MKTLLVLFAVGCGVHGNGLPETTTRAVTGFTAVELQTSLPADVAEGAAFSVQVSIDGNLQGAVVTEVTGDTLILRTSGAFTNEVHGSSIHVTLPALAIATVSGSGDMTVSTSSQNAVALTVSGSGHLSFSGSASELRLTSSGSGALDTQSDAARQSVTLSDSGHANLHGTTDMLTAQNDGTGTIDAQALSATKAILGSTRSGTLDATVTGSVTQATNSGSGHIHIYGGASIASQSNTGSGSIDTH